MHLVLIGTKAQLVKMAPVLLSFDRAGLPYRFVLSGQHSETMDDLIHEFGLREPDGNLLANVEADTKMKLASWFWNARITLKSDEYAQDTSSIIVHGDTASALLGARYGQKHNIPVVHVEAGLRSFNYLHPFPEELIRVLVSRQTSLHFCPGATACSNIRSRIGSGASIIDTRLNTIIDSLRLALVSLKPIDSGEDYCVASIHRHENLSNRSRFDWIMNFIVETSRKIKVRFVLHPVTRKKLENSHWKNEFHEAGIDMVERTGYIAFIHTLAKSRFLISDGGSNQEESAYMGLPCLIMRKASERKEGLDDTAVISNFQQTISHQFVDNRLNESWQLRNLPEIYPSKVVTEGVIQTFQN